MQQSVTHVITTIEMGGAEKQLLVLVEQQLRSGLRVEVIYLKGRPELEENFKIVGATVANDFVGIPFLLQLLLLRKIMKSWCRFCMSGLLVWRPSRGKKKSMWDGLQVALTPWTAWRCLPQSLL